MKILTVGHKYELDNFEAKDQPGQVIQFIEKIPNPEASGQFQTVNDGTTNEEVLRMLIDRMQVLQAFRALESRTTNRVNRGVEVKPLS